jgi:hypothetical protein
MPRKQRNRATVGHHLPSTASRERRLPRDEAVDGGHCIEEGKLSRSLVEPLRGQPLAVP